MPLLKYSTVNEAVARANAAEYGLAGTVWGAGASAAAEVAARSWYTTGPPQPDQLGANGTAVIK